MSGYYRCMINGIGVQDISPCLTITSIEEKAPELELQTSPNAKYDGTHVTGFFRRSLQIAVKMWCKERRMERRAQLLDQIREWSDDGVMTVNYRPHQQLQVVRTSLPSFGGDWKFAEEIELQFTAYGIPFWQSDNLTVVYLGTAGTSKDIAIQPPGTSKQCFLRWDLTNSGSGTLTALKLASLDNGSFITLNGLSIAPGGRVVADYDLNGYLTIRDGNGSSLLNKRNADSYDDVTLTQRKGNTIRVTADSPVTGFLSARGLYL